MGQLAVQKLVGTKFCLLYKVIIGRSEAPVRSEFLSLLRISEFFGFQWQKLAEILSLFKLYNNLGKVAVRVKLWLIIYCGHECKSDSSGGGPHRPWLRSYR